MLAIPIFGLRQGPGFPGFDALTPCIGAAMFIWSGIGVPTVPRMTFAPLEIVRFFGRISYSLYLWHWPLFTFARFAKNGLVLDAADKAALFLVTVAISYLSWRYVEQPFRDRTLAPTQAAAFRMAGLSSACLLVAGIGGAVLSRTLSDADRDAIRLEAYNTYDPAPIYRPESVSRRRTASLKTPACRLRPARPTGCCGATALRRIIITGCFTHRLRSR